MRLGLDSTDSRDGGCTTYVALQILHRLPDLVVRRAPYLVRLNPNVPYKTRGNGAISFELGHPKTAVYPVGEMEGEPVWAAQDVEPPTPAEAEHAFDVARRVVEELRSPGSGSALVLFDDPPPTVEYEQAVQRHVATPGDWPAGLKASWGDGRGVIGARAACAWPGASGTWEAIAYRSPSRVGTPRGLDAALGPELDQDFPATFDNWDASHDHLRIMPASPCPVLAGIRGTDRAAVTSALGRLRPERPDAWLAFWTNQATGDHLRESRLADVAPFDCVRVRVRVTQEPRTIAGGHVFLAVADDSASATAAAFEPTKELRNVVRALRVGDVLELEAGVHEDPSVLALEAVTVLEPARVRLLRPPGCRACGRAMKSAGRRGGYRCRSCGTSRSVQEAREATIERTVPRQRFTVPTIVRRHLARPPVLDASSPPVPSDVIA